MDELGWDFSQVISRQSSQWRHEDEDIKEKFMRLNSASLTSNFNTDSSLEDDGISMILSHCSDACNFESHIRSSTRSLSNGPTLQVFTVDSGGSGSSDSNIDHLLHSDSEGGYPKPRKSRPEKRLRLWESQPDVVGTAQMKEMVYRAAVFRPVNDGEKVVEKPKRKNVRISSDPQTVAARQRRERISERMRVLQRLVPGGNKMDTASMLDEAANYLKFLRSQVQTFENLGHKFHDSLSWPTPNSLPFNCLSFPVKNFLPSQTTPPDSIRPPMN